MKKIYYKLSHPTQSPLKSIYMDPFVREVKAMREAQKLWFRFHNKNDLKKALRIEMRVDSMIAEYKVLEPAPPSQRGLYDDDITEF
jgi:hypothetical protein